VFTGFPFAPHDKTVVELLTAPVTRLIGLAAYVAVLANAVKPVVTKSEFCADILIANVVFAARLGINTDEVQVVVVAYTAPATNTPLVFKYFVQAPAELICIAYPV
jgi:hypothetical protein